MSWNICVAGPNNKALRKYVEKQESCASESGEHQIDVVKSAIGMLLDRIPDGALVTIEANGHPNYMAGSRASGKVRFQLKVWPTADSTP